MPDSGTKELTSAERRALRARAHHLHPAIMIGNAGLTADVLREVHAALKSQELIKIRVLGEDRDARAELVDALCEATGAQPVQRIGKMLVIYRPKPPEEQKPAKPRRAKRKAPRRTKRSYQM